MPYLYSFEIVGGLVVGLIQTGLRVRQVTDQIPTICKRCNKKETSLFYDDGSFTKRCGCGTTSYEFHKADEHNDSRFIKIFFPISREDKDWKKKSLPEKMGFKRQKNGVFVK